MQRPTFDLHNLWPYIDTKMEDSPNIGDDSRQIEDDNIGISSHDKAVLNRIFNPNLPYNEIPEEIEDQNNYLGEETSISSLLFFCKRNSWGHRSSVILIVSPHEILEYRSPVALLT